MNFKNLIYTILFLCSAIPFANSAETSQQQRILMVGNSYTFYNNMPTILEAMLNEDKNKKAQYSVEKLAVGGAKLQDFTTNQDLLQKIDSKSYDILILQEQSTTMLYSNEKGVSQAAIKFLSDRAHKNGLRVYLLSTWARKAGSDFYSGPTYSNFTPPANPDEMTKIVHNYYEQAAKANGIMMIPVGQFWNSVIKKNIGLELYNSDSSHPSMLGSYLVAMLVYSALSGEIPDQDLWHPSKITEQEKLKLVTAITGKQF